MFARKQKTTGERLFFHARKLSGLFGLRLFLGRVFLGCLGLGGLLFGQGTVSSLGLFGTFSELLEAINTAARVDELLLAGVERMALGTDFRVDDGIGGAHDKLGAADTADLYFFVIGGVDTGFHKL